MIVRRLKPKNDFIFARLFGEQETKDSLIALLNAILRLSGSNQITDLTVIDNKQLHKQLIDDKTGRLDVRAETADRVQIDIEIQLSNQGNMIRRTLFYMSKMYSESIKAGGKYEDLKKTITINILDFNLLNIPRFHSTFHFYEDQEEHFLLTDALEIHFIEYPKFRMVEKQLDDPLHRWLLFLDDKLTEDQFKELMEMDTIIRQTEARLEWLSGDEETVRLYEARENSQIELNSRISEATSAGKAEGKAEGKAAGKAEVALNMLREGLDKEFVAKVTGFSLVDLESLAKDK